MDGLRLFQQDFLPVLTKLIDSRLERLERTLQDEFLLAGVSHVKTLLLAGGKRVRPYMAHLLYRAGGGNHPQALSIFAGLELFHAFALIHDDIMDKAQVRHGVPTADSFMVDALAQAQRLGDYRHLGKSQAILFGDLLFSWASECFSEVPGIAPERFQAARREFFAMAEAVMVGQMIDVDIMSRSAVSDELLLKKMYLKTASYTFVYPLRIGAALAGAEQLFPFTDAFGKAVGIAFQLQDDLLDVTATEAELGKPVFSDIRDRQHTFLSQYLFTHGTPAQQQTFLPLFGSPHINEAHRETLHALFTESGALAAGEQRIREHLDEAHRLLAGAPLPEASRAAFLELLDYLGSRTI